MLLRCAPAAACGWEQQTLYCCRVCKSAQPASCGSTGFCYNIKYAIDCLLMVGVYGSCYTEHGAVDTVLCQGSAGLPRPPALLLQSQSQHQLQAYETIQNDAGRFAGGEREWVGVKCHVKGQYSLVSLVRADGKQLGDKYPVMIGNNPAHGQAVCLSLTCCRKFSSRCKCTCPTCGHSD
jgi:hypothetical protein